MNYEFHVGDYVETVGGAKGYICDANKDWWRCTNADDEYSVGYVDYWKIYWSEACHEPALLLRGIAKKDGKELPMDFNFVCSDIPRHFNRIGKYTFGHFTKKGKKKIENLVKPQWSMPVEDLIDKINELVDAVNKLMDKEDNE